MTRINIRFSIEDDLWIVEAIYPNGEIKSSRHYILELALNASIRMVYFNQNTVITIQGKEA